MKCTWPGCKEDICGEVVVLLSPDRTVDRVCKPKCGEHHQRHMGLLYPRFFNGEPAYIVRDYAPGVNFSTALAHMKTGHHMARDGWNHAFYWVVLQPGYPDGVALNAVTAGTTGFLEGTVVKFRPYFLLCVGAAELTPWVPSVGDLLADDWRIVGEPVR